ncbi:MAG: hypothetical protein AAGG46_10615, partial [Planctomycetota bacterium]
MPQLINSPLETYLSGQLAEPVKCFVCEHENRSSVERCCECGTPIALSRQAAPPNRLGVFWRAPRLIAVVGGPRSGKTVFLGMLVDMLVRGALGRAVTLRGAFSLEMQQTATTALASGNYPEKSGADPEHWRWAHCRVHGSGRRRSTEFVLADIAGEAWADEADHPGRRPALLALLRRAAGVVVIADAQRLHAGDHADEFVALKLLSMMDEKQQKPLSRGRSAKRPLAMVLTKADELPSVSDEPNRFADTHAEVLLRECRGRFADVRAFG